MPILDFDELVTPLLSILKQRKTNPRKELKWTGPTKLHHRVGATCLPPHENFSKEGLAYHKERGRSFEEVFIMVALQLGISQGISMVEDDPTANIFKKLADKFLEEKAKPVPTVENRISRYSIIDFQGLPHIAIDGYPIFGTAAHDRDSIKEWLTLFHDDEMIESIFQSYRDRGGTI